MSGRRIDLPAVSRSRRQRRSLAMSVDVGDVDEDALRRDSRLARIDHPPLLAALTHHDLAAVELHFAMHAARRRADAHDLLEPEGAGEPIERRRHVAVEDVGDDLGAGSGLRLIHERVLLVWRHDKWIDTAGLEEMLPERRLPSLESREGSTAQIRLRPAACAA